MKISDWMHTAKKQLVNSDKPKRDLEILLGMVTGKSRAWLMAYDDSTLTTCALMTLTNLVERRAIGEPMAYLIGEREFWSLPLKVTPDTMIPRPDTEIVVEQTLIRMTNASCSILDLGTGSGAIALAIASERKNCHVLGIDCIRSVIDLAKYNALKLGINNASFRLGRWFSTIQDQKFAIIVSNPPYIDISDLHLLEGDLRFEPKSALISGNHGLADIALIIAEAGKHLIHGGWLLLEHGWQQGNIIRHMMRKYGFVNIKTAQDYGGHERVTLGRYR
ncbi:peptide chain release factor N(5)-glutamine methyltransferase [Candidatus Erwinia haradaeae]|uniref:Release factor glutamine methyltransferase n=1 Tax=Candidatus Erwinia haradaeae TaxID=1922217 RepID=A0A451DA33_9GAMM|nr:peptide chain release factor N(5)-glutamine methyltransferase [Candidatus Erwinia haradaeae]VFP83173.1 Release factor glutamine methyltransferase [Candidatus Erwinia haradaeae]